MSRSIEGATLAPIVAAGIGKNVTLRAERRAQDGAIDGGETLESLLVVLIPDVDNTITANSSKDRPFGGMEGDMVYTKDVFPNTMALEIKGLFFTGFAKGMNCTTAFNTTDEVALGIGKGGNAPKGLAENIIGNSALYLTGLGTSLDVVRDDMTLSSCNNQQATLDIERVAPFGQIKHGSWLRRTCIPELDRFVPTTTNGKVGYGGKSNMAYWSVMITNLLGNAVGWQPLSQLVHTNGVVCTATNHRVSV